MNDKAKFSERADRDPVTPVSTETRPTLKAWVRPKVMVSSLADDVAATANTGADGAFVC